MSCGSDDDDKDGHHWQHNPNGIDPSHLVQVLVESDNESTSQSQMASTLVDDDSGNNKDEKTLEIMNESDNDSIGPIPVEHQLAALLKEEKMNRGDKKLEFIDDETNNLPIVPIEKHAVALEIEEGVVVEATLPLTKGSIIAVANDHQRSDSSIATIVAASDNLTHDHHQVDTCITLTNVTEDHQQTESSTDITTAVDNVIITDISSASSLSPLVGDTSMSTARNRNIEGVPSTSSLPRSDNDPLHPIFFEVEATVVDNQVYKAFPVQPPYWKRNPTNFVSAILAVITATATAVAVPAFLLTLEKQKRESEQKNSTPVSRKGECFTNKRELSAAIDQYLDQDCANDDGCFVGQRYGWPMNNWCVSNVRDMLGLFSGLSKFNEDISDWDVSSVTNMLGMFMNAVVFNGDLSRWDVSSVTNMGGMFSHAEMFNGGSISNWNVSSVTDMSEMFMSAYAFNGDLSKWDVSSVTDMSWMFYETTLDCDLSQWDVSSVTSMVLMFYNAYKFNADLSSWNVSYVTDMGGMFDGAAAFNCDLSRWDVSSVNDMYNMFAGAKAFDGNLSSWNVSSVNDMSYMFFGANAFNGDLSNWDIRSVSDMQKMFSGAISFNQDLCEWSDKFPYGLTTDTFAYSGCTYKNQPTQYSRGPFCASLSCGG